MKSFISKIQCTDEKWNIGIFLVEGFFNSYYGLTTCLHEILFRIKPKWVAQNEINTAITEIGKIEINVIGTFPVKLFFYRLLCQLLHPVEVIITSHTTDNFYPSLTRNGVVSEGFLPPVNRLNKA